MKIQVRQKHIDNGEPNCCRSCAIALALKDYFPKAKNIKVEASNDMSMDGNRIEVVDDDLLEVRKFIHLFDSEYEVKPFKFSLKQ